MQTELESSSVEQARLRLRHTMTEGKGPSDRMMDRDDSKVGDGIQACWDTPGDRAPTALGEPSLSFDRWAPCA